MMRVVIVVRYQYLSVMWEVLNILNILMRILYLMLSPLMVVKILMVMKVTNLLQRCVTSQIKIHTYPVHVVIPKYQFQNMNIN